MKKILLAGLFLFSLTMVNAQSASKSCASKSAASACCSSKTASAAKASASSETATAVLSAIEAAEKDENIQVKKDAESGNVSYYKKAVCSESGKVTLSEVSYDSANGVFVNTSPSGEKASAKACCSSDSKSKAGCCSSGKASKASKTNKAIGVGLKSTDGEVKRPKVKQIQ